MSFQDNVDRDNWYHMLVEMRCGWDLSQSELVVFECVDPLPIASLVAELKDPCVMETAQGHVILQNAINQSGLMDQCNHQQRRKRAMVCG